MEAYIRNQYENLGFDINPDIFKEYARVAGAKRTVVVSPVYKRLEENQIAICNNVTLKYGGLEDN